MRAAYIGSGLLALVLISSVAITNGARILFFLGLSSHSHRVAIQPLATALAERGHDVTFFSPFEPEVPNPKIKEFCPQVLKDMNAAAVEQTGDVSGRLKDKNFDPFAGTHLWDLMYGVAEATVTDEEFLKWLKNSTFDLIIHDHPAKEYIYAYAYHTKAKIISFHPGSAQFPSDIDTFGHPFESSFKGMFPNPYWYVPDRLFFAFDTIFRHLTYKDYFLAKIETLARKNFEFDFPPIVNLMKKTDLHLLNQHISIGHAYPLPPNVIAVGGMYIKESNGTLPKDIEDFLADSEQFIYLSFGSLVKVSMLPPETQQHFFDAVAAFPKTKFLWKWEGDAPKNMPANSLPRKWFPQQDVLSHPKCRGFMTQGGQISMHQAIHNGVPLIVVPGFTDQVYNAKAAQHHNFGMYLELMDVTKDTLAHAFEEVLKNKKYREAAQVASKRFRDRPMSALDTAVWWTEYVLRHDTEHLRSEGTYLTWIQRRSLDVWLLAFSAILVLLLALVYAVKKILKVVLHKSAEKQKKN